MNKYVKLIIFIGIIGVFAVLVCFIWHAGQNQEGATNMRDCVSTQATAEKIALAVCEDMYPDKNLDQFVMSVKFDAKNDVWVVSFSKNREDRSQVIAGGGGPIVHVSKKTAEIKEIFLQR